MPTLSQEFGFPTNIQLGATPGSFYSEERVRKDLDSVHADNLRRTAPLSSYLAQDEAVARIRWWAIRGGQRKPIVTTLQWIADLPATELGLVRVPGSYRFRLDQDWMPAAMPTQTGPGSSPPFEVGPPTGPTGTGTGTDAGPLEQVSQAIAAADPTLVMVGIAAATVGVLGLTAWAVGAAKDARGPV